MDIEILAVGTELLMGQIANTNAQYISQRLPESGANVFFHSVSGDNPVRLRVCLETAFRRCDTVITTGGLGPTEDDLTKETVAEFFNRKLVTDRNTLSSIRNFFIKSGRPVPDNVFKQAEMPEGCRVISNRVGTAPGCIIEDGCRTIIMLPGPPSEMIPMFEESVMPYIASKTNHRIGSRFVKILGLGESAVEKQLIDLIDSQTNPTLATYVKEGEVILRITAKCGKNEDPQKLIEPVLNEVISRLGDNIYDTCGRSIEEVLYELLKKSSKTVSFAESCTGGLLSESLTGIPGASSVFLADAVCYSNNSKVSILGVKKETIEKYGAVSRETALEMAEGIKRLSGSDYGVSVTGIAGPDGGTAEKPVGLVYIALSDEGGTVAKELRFSGSRDRIRNLSKLHAFDFLRRRIGESFKDA